uniref:Uncharacterized protein n=1 Tax=Rhizophora mucronata TaxID=61149 RepID=A0A2P2PHM7_RHIMU
MLKSERTDLFIWWGTTKSPGPLMGNR